MRDLGHLKLIHFFLYAVSGAIIPYLPLLFIRHGIGIVHCGFILSLPPVIGLVFRPMLMSLVEKLVIYKTSLLLVLAFNTVNLLSLQAIHSYEHCPEFPSPLSLPAKPICLDSQWHDCTYDDYATNGSICCHPKPDVGISCPMSFNYSYFGSYRIVEGSVCQNCSHSFENLQLAIVQQQVCSEGKQTVCEENSPMWSYIVIVAIYGVYSCIMTPILDALTSQMLKNIPDCDLDMQKLWGSVGFGSAAFVSSIFLSLSDYIGFATRGFTPFIPFVVLSVISMVLILCFKFNQPTPSAQLLFGLSSVIHNLDCAVFVGCVAVFGMLAGVHSIFFILYLIEIDALYIILGICLFSYSLMDVTFHFARKRVVSFFGCKAMLYICLCVYAMRFMWYSWQRNPLLILPVEVCHGVCCSCMWWAALEMSRQLSPLGLSSALQSILTNTYHSVGAALGAITGGIIYEVWGSMVLWRVCSVTSLVTCFLFIVHNQIISPVLNSRVPAETTAEFFEDDLEDLLDDETVNFQQFQSDEEFLVMDAPTNYAIVNSKGEQYMSPQAQVENNNDNMFRISDDATDQMFTIGEFNV